MDGRHSLEEEGIEATEFWGVGSKDIQPNYSENERNCKETIFETQECSLASHDSDFLLFDMNESNLSEEDESRKIAGESKNTTNIRDMLSAGDSDNAIECRDAEGHQKSLGILPIFHTSENNNVIGQNCGSTYRANIRPVKTVDVRIGEHSAHASIHNQQSNREMFYQSPGRYLKAKQINTSVDTAAVNAGRKHDNQKAKVNKLMTFVEKIKTKVHQSNSSSTESIRSMRRAHNVSETNCNSDEMLSSKLLNPSTLEERKSSCYEDETGISAKEWKDQDFSNNVEMKADEVTGNMNNDAEGSARKKCISNENQRTQEILNDAMKFFKPRGENVNAWVDVPSDFSNIRHTNMKSTIYNRKQESASYCGINADDDIQTLEDALKYFKLSSSLKNLEKSLDEVRSCRKTKEQHENLLKQIDKEMQKLSLTYHPDKVKSRGGTEEELIRAQKIQTTLNATRTVLNILSVAFLEDISTDHKYGFYTKLHMSSLGNENEIKNRVYEVLFKIGMISEIKQEYIISEIRKFLIGSKCCVKEYLDNHVKNFEKYRDLALFHLKCCIKGYEKLYLEFKEVGKECKRDKLDNISSVIFKMESDCRRELNVLKALQKTAENSLKNYKFFTPDDHMDPYFVLPFVSYVNVILMCNVMMKEASLWDILTPSSSAVVLDPARSFGATSSTFNAASSTFNAASSTFIPVSLSFDILKNTSLFGKSASCSQGLPDGELIYLTNPYYLTSCYSGDHNKEMVLNILAENGYDAAKALIKGRIRKDVIKKTFSEILLDVNKYLEKKFTVDKYVENSSKNILQEEMKRCVTMMYTFKEKKKELLQDVEIFKKKTEAMEEEFDKCDKLLLETEELNRNVTESLQMNQKLNEIISSFLTDKQ